MKSSSLVTTGSAVVLLILIGLGGFWYYLMVNSGNPAQGGTQGLDLTRLNITNQDVYQSLEETNPAFVEGMSLLRDGQYDAAIVKLEGALTIVIDDYQRMKVLSALATAQERGGYPIDAVKTYKEIAAFNGPNTARASSYAIQQIALIYYFGSNDDDIVNVIFNETPWTSFLKLDDAQLTVRRLFEYSASFWPSAVAEVQIANWYANELVASETATPALKLSAEQTASYIQEIQKHLLNAEKDFDYMRGQPQLSDQLNNALSQRTIVLSKLFEVGLVSEDVVVQGFDEFLAAYDGAPAGVDGMARYYYASFLARAEGDAAYDRVVALIAPVYTDDMYHDSIIERSLRNVGWGIEKQARNIVPLMQVDPEFKDYLRSLGWTSQSFSAAEAAYNDVPNNVQVVIPAGSTKETSVSSEVTTNTSVESSASAVSPAQTTQTPSTQTQTSPTKPSFDPNVKCNTYPYALCVECAKDRSFPPEQYESYCSVKQ